LKNEGGYGLTHIGKLKKIDKTPFLGKDATSMLYALEYFLSFTKGAWCVPVCAVGYDSSGNPVWESWSSPYESYSGSQSWFDKHHSEQMEKLFPGFMNRWNDEYWNDTFQKVIYWYLNANKSRIDAGVLLTQTAIERLTFSYFKGKSLSSDSAGLRIKQLLSCLDIPICLTEATPNLKRVIEELKAVGTKCDDAPHAITLVRNSLVHPDSKYSGLFKSDLNKPCTPNILYETYNLGLWYLELSMLKLCGYWGTYSNRLTAKVVGEIEDVPWKK
jgi:hypothetical protein